MTDICEETVQTRAGGDKEALVTIVSASGSTHREEGAKMMSRADGRIPGTIGGGSVEAYTIGEAHAVIQTGKPQRSNKV